MHTLRPFGLVYLATPYSNYAGGHEAAFVDAANLAGRLLSCGVKIFSPISHGHPISKHGDLDPLNHDIWLALDEAFLGVCDCLAVALMPGWDKSKGVKFEIDYFTLAKKPIYDLNPKTLEATRRAE